MRDKQECGTVDFDSLAHAMKWQPGEKQMSKLDEAREYEWSHWPSELNDNAKDTQLTYVDDLLELRVRYEKAIEEIISQKDKEIEDLKTRLKTSKSERLKVIDSLRKRDESIKNLMDQRNELRQSKQIEVDQELIEWLRTKREHYKGLDCYDSDFPSRLLSILKPEEKKWEEIRIHTGGYIICAYNKNYYNHRHCSRLCGDFQGYTDDKTKIKCSYKYNKE